MRIAMSCRRALPGLLILALAAGMARSQPAVEAPAVADSLLDAPTDSLAADRLPEPPFGVGERLVFSINYGAVNAGEGVLEVARMVDFQGHRCYRIESTASSAATPRATPMIEINVIIETVARFLDRK